MGLGFVDAPVSGGQAGAENGVLSVMCGGDPAHFASAEPVIAAYARICRLLGPSGAGQLAKMVNQICIAGLVQGLAEGLHFAEKAGLEHPRSRRGHQPGRRRKLADGQPSQDHGRKQVRLRICCGLDAQGSRHLPCRLPMKTAQACRSPRWSTSFTRMCRNWAATAGTPQA
jgi:hypothetical protein